MINADDYFGGLTEEEYVKQTEEHFKWLEENSKKTDAEKYYEHRDCPFSPFDEYCTGHCVNCENWSEYVELIEKSKCRAIEEFWTKVRTYAVVMGCYHIVEYGDKIVKEMVGTNK